MKKYFIIFLLVCSKNIFAQNPVATQLPPEEQTEDKGNEEPNEKKQKKNTNYDQEPLFKGFIKHLETNLKYPKEAIEQNITGNVIIEFTVNKKGVLSNFKLSPTSPQKNIHLVNESIRVLKLSSGKWTPAKKDKKSIVANFSKSIMFAIVED